MEVENGHFNNLQLLGDECFTYSGEDTELTVREFWSWYFSDLLDIKTRVAEYLVSKALGMNEAYNTGYWTAQSIKYRERRLELRSAAYMKSIADIEPSVEHIRHIDIRVRENDVYVFCLLPGKTKEKANPLVLDNWKFYVIPTWYIRLECGSNGTITMAKVQRLVKQTEFKNLKADIDQAIDTIEALRKTKPLG